MSTKFDSIKAFLKENWGFDLWKNDTDAHGYWPGAWKSGYTIQGTLRGSFLEHYRSLAEIERSAWMKEYKAHTWRK